MPARNARTRGRAARQPHAHPVDEALESRRLLSLALVTDLNTDTDSSGPTGFTESGGLLFFAANDGPHGVELWKTDGTPQGTALVKDIDPRPEFRYPVGQMVFDEGSSRPTGLTDLNGTLYFYADDGVHGAELWKSDGTEAGTVLVKDINPGPGGSNYVYAPGVPGPSFPTVSIAVLDGALYFFAFDDAGGKGLWRSDGTEAGTVKVEAFPQMSREAVVYLNALDGRLHFSGYEAATGSEPWVSDGTAAGTRLLKDLVPGPASSHPRDYTMAGGDVFFTAATGATVGGVPLHAVWRTDGTEAGTDPVAGGFRTVELGPVGSTLYFGSSDDTLVGTLWKLEDDAAAPARVRDFPDAAPYRSMNPPRWLTALNGALMFVVFDDDAGFELWRSDGTPGGTQRVKDVLPGPASGSPSSLKAVNGVLYFNAAGAVAGEFNLPADSEPWRSDGTEAGTVKLKDIAPGVGGSYPEEFTPYRGRVLFVASTPRKGRELWHTDGTESGTTLLKDVNTDTLDGTGFGPVVSGGRFYFTGTTDETGTEIYVTDGAAGGTRLLKDIVPGPGGSYPRELTDVDGTLYFLASDGASADRDLWKTDGTPEGTVLVKPDVIDRQGGGSDPTLLALGDTLLFSGEEPDHGMELWKSDGTPEGTGLVKDIRPGPDSGGAVLIATLGTTALFWANDDVHGSELWKTDGTEAGTVLVKDVNPGPDGSGDWLGVPALVSNGVAYFGAYDLEAGLEPWRSDGTAGGTFRLGDLRPGPAPEYSYPKDFTAFDGQVYFLANDGMNRMGLYRTDGTPTGTRKVPIDFGPGSVELADLNAANGSLYFTATVNGRSAFYRSDGSAEGTVLLKQDLAAGKVTALGGKLYFAGRTGIRFSNEASGPEPWETDGTPEGTRLIADLRPGREGSYPAPFVTNGSVLLFTANDVRHGRELWRITPDDPPPGARVIGRYAFYNNSAFDAAEPASPVEGRVADDFAIGFDKRPWLPGRGLPSFDNITTYTKGINGVMIDVANLPQGVELTPADFGATVAPREVTVRRGAGVDRSDRVTLIWDDYNPASTRAARTVVANGWLTVTVKANERTGLASPDVFSFGNLIGETGGDVGGTLGWRVNALDLAAVRRALTRPAAVTSTTDFNRDGRTNALDLAVVKRALNTSLPPPPAPAAFADDLALRRVAQVLGLASQ